LTLSLKSGVVVPVLLMLPNIVWMLLPKLAMGSKASVPLALSIAENVARVVVLALPFFLTIQMAKKYSTLTVVGMTLALTLYYTAWARYFAGGNAVALLSAPLLGIPSPLAFAPIVFLILSSYLMHSWWMLAAATIFGALHVWVSAIRS
jgi:hypothetical protein